MRLRNHLKILVAVTIAWVLFLLAGFPDYYQQYSTRFMILFDAALLLPLWLIIFLLLKAAKRRSRLILSLWYSFYITVPLLLYDFFYCGLYLGHGLDFITRFWYLSVYYVIPWIILPPTGLWLDRRMQLEKECV